MKTLANVRRNDLSNSQSYFHRHTHEAHQMDRACRICAKRENIVEVKWESGPEAVEGLLRHVDFLNQVLRASCTVMQPCPNSRFPVPSLPSILRCRRRCRSCRSGLKMSFVRKPSSRTQMHARCQCDLLGRFDKDAERSRSRSDWTPPMRKITHATVLQGLWQTQHDRQLMGGALGL